MPSRTISVLLSAVAALIFATWLAAEDLAPRSLYLEPGSAAAVQTR